MRDYAKIIPTFWTGETGKKIREAGPEVQVAALYLLSSPHSNAFGLYYLPMLFMSHETGIPLRRIPDILEKLEGLGFCRYDAASEFVWVIEMASFQIGDLKPEDNRLKPLRRAWQALPANPFSGPFFDKYGQNYGLERRSTKALREGLPSPSGGLQEGSLSPQIIEQEQEQEKEQEQEQDKKPRVRARDLEIEIPIDLKCSEQEIRDWLEYKRQKGQRYKAKGLEALWRVFREIHPEERRAAVDHSMANNYAGLFQQNGGGNGKQGTHLGRNGHSETDPGKFAGITKTIEVQ